MDEPTNHLDLASSEALADALVTFEGTLVFVSHNRSFVRRLATKIWNVEDGAVDTYPGALDEYLERHRQTAAEAKASAKAPRAAVAAVAAAPRAAEPAKPDAGPPVTPPRSREEERVRRRNEAEQRGHRNRALGPLKTRVKELEAEIERLESAQRERNLELAKPEVYADAPRRNQLLTEYHRDADALADATSQWEVSVAELEALESQLTF